MSDVSGEQGATPAGNAEDGPWWTWSVFQPTRVPLDGSSLDALDGAKILAAPDDPSDWPAWRDALGRWREEARARVAYDGSQYERPELAWTQRCFALGFVALWEELIYDHAEQRFTPDRLIDDAQERFGGWDGVILWHAYPVLGIDERNQFDFYRDVAGIEELFAAFRRRGVRTFVDYNPWDTGTRREPVGDAEAVAAIARSLGADGVFLDTLTHAEADMRQALRDFPLQPELEVPIERIRDHHLSWAQYYADSAVPGVLAARWFEQRHMLHNICRWNHDHSGELHSAWLNGTGMLVWELAHGTWAGWNDRDRAILRTMLPVQREHAELLTSAEWTPLAARSDELLRPRVVGSSWGPLWTLVNRDSEPFQGRVLRDDADPIEVVLPPRGVAALLGDDVIAVSEDADTRFPERPARRVPPPSARASEAPAGMVAAPPPRPVVARFHHRETGIYGARCLDPDRPVLGRTMDWLLGSDEVARPAPDGRFAIGVREVTAAEFARFKHGYPAGDGPATRVTLAEARAYAAWAGARLPTEDEWQLAAEAGLLERAEPHVWNWTESEHTNGRKRFVILKGGSGFYAEGSDWYVDGRPDDPAYSLEYLLGNEIERSSWIGFRLAVDLP